MRVPKTINIQMSDLYYEVEIVSELITVTVIKAKYDSLK